MAFSGLFDMMTAIGEKLAAFWLEKVYETKTEPVRSDYASHLIQPPLS